MSDSRYGLSVYGRSPYGSGLPRKIYATSIDLYNIEIQFPVEILWGPEVTDVINYILIPVFGAAPISINHVTVSSIGITGVDRVNINHSGTTLGGVYNIKINNLVDIEGNTLETGNRNYVNFLASGGIPNYLVYPISGNEIVVEFGEEIIYSPEMIDVSEYEINTQFPIPMTPQTVSFPYGGDNKKIHITNIGMTSTEYEMRFFKTKSMVYDGSIMPDASTEFNGVEFGGGLSIADGSLKLNKSIGNEYGWNFQDISGKISPVSSYYLKFKLNFNSASISPPLFDSDFFTLIVSDGTNQVSTIFRVALGNDEINFKSGSYNQSIIHDWRNREIEIGVLRNKKSNTQVLIVDSIPYLTGLISWFDDPAAIPPGILFYLNSPYSVSDMEIIGAEIDSSSSVYSSSWNFLFDLFSTFTGSDLLARRNILTENGPLVKSWGDNTPATKNDVAVRLNGLEVEVRDVDPYFGSIELETPIPLMPPGTVTAEIDYHWMPSPLMEIGGLNIVGSVLNQWSNPSGLEYPVSGTGNSAGNSYSRFNMKLVLGPVDRPQPIYRGVRYFGFGKEESAVLNDYTSLLLNQDPDSISVQNFKYDYESETGSYTGGSEPTDNDKWKLVGSNDGQLTIDDHYIINDNNSGRFPHESNSFFYRDIGSPGSLSVYLSFRTKVLKYDLDGVYTGIGVGFHDRKRCYLIGLLEVNGLKHVGILNGYEVENELSWKIGPETRLEIIGRNLCRVHKDLSPSSLEIGDRFQVFSGNQAGVYSISDVFLEGRYVYIEISTQFPSDYRMYDSSIIDSVFEVRWDNNFYSYRVFINTETDSVEVYVSGEISSNFSIGGINLSPQQLPFFMPSDDYGKMFWGSIGRKQINSSEWAFVRYNILPTINNSDSGSIIVSTELNNLPEDDRNSEWFIDKGFGNSFVRSGKTIIKTFTNTKYGGDYIYKRIEPSFTNKNYVDLDCKFNAIEDGQSGDCSVVINDGLKESKLVTLCYYEPGPGHNRELSVVDSVSMFGAIDNEWESTEVNGLEIERTDTHWILKRNKEYGGFFYKNLENVPSYDLGNRIFETRFRVDNQVSTSEKSSIAFIIEGGPVNRSIGLSLLNTPNRVCLTKDSDCTVVGESNFNWQDGEYHTYRVIVDVGVDTVTLLVDGSVLVVSSFSDFSLSSDNGGVFFGSYDIDANSRFELKLEYLFYRTENLSSVKRTLGVLIGDNGNDIDSYIIPRSDGLNVPNSSPSASVIEYDWRVSRDYRLQLDPFWGLRLFDPTIPPPPLTNLCQPNPIVSVEYQNLPTRKSLFGSISWGSTGAISESAWDYIRYHIYIYRDGNRIQSPSNMVLNKYSLLNSGEISTDKTFETKTIISSDPVTVMISDCGITAKNVLNVIVDGFRVDRSKWKFDHENQRIIFNEAIGTEFNYPVTIVFAAGNPVTYTYLLEQPLFEGNIILNDDTPVEQSNQYGGSYTILESGEVIYNRNGDYVDNTPFEYCRDLFPETTKYSDIDIIESRTNGEYGLLSFACDETFSGHGLIDVGFDSGSYYDRFSDLLSDGFYGNNSVIKSPFVNPTYPVMIMGGNGHYDGSIGPGTSVLYQNYKISLENYMGMNQTLFIDMKMGSFTDNHEFFPIEADNTPPSYSIDQTIVPDGVPGIHFNGSCLAVQNDNGNYSKIGPHGGIDSLQNSILVGSEPLYGSVEKFTMYGGSPIETGTLIHFNIEASS